MIRQIGNAVPIVVAEVLEAEILKARFIDDGN
jgi:hypothetical protein